MKEHITFLDVKVFPWDNFYVSAKANIKNFIWEMIQIVKSMKKCTLLVQDTVYKYLNPTPPSFT